MGTLGSIGPYRLLGELGRGAMARVWRAWDPNLQREVAIKEPLHDEGYPSSVLEEMGSRFVAEGRTAARLSHPGIVTIYAADVWDGRPAIVMELITGETLGQTLKHGPMTPVRALAVLDQLLDAVGYAHARGVVHRDIKPDNIFLTAEDRVKLADFGIARFDGSIATLGTVAGAVLGTPGYMSPEQATGTPVDARSDLFSVGVVAYEMLSGVNPFGAGAGTDATTLLYRIVHEPIPELPALTARGLPVDLRPAIMSALEKDPAARPQSAEEFRAMLHGVQPAQSMRSNTNVQESFLSRYDAAERAIRSSRTNRYQAEQFLHGNKSPQYGDQSQTTRGRTTNASPAWLPYVLVVAVAAVALGFVFMNATKGGSGTISSSPAVQNQTEAQPNSDGSGSSSTGIDSPYYVAVSEGKVAIFSNSAATPYEMSDVWVTDLGKESAAKLDNRIPAATLDEARELVEAFRQQSISAMIESDELLEESSRYEDEHLLPEYEREVFFSRDEYVNLRSQSRHDSDLVYQAWNDEALYFDGKIGTGYGSDGALHQWYYVNVSGKNIWGWVRSDLVV